MSRHTSSPDLTIVIPARKEEKAIIPTLELLRKHVATPHRVIVVNDQNDPNDQTADFVARYAKKRTNVSLIVYTSGRGQSGFSGAILEGIKHVTSGAVVFVMADMCDEPETIDVMYGKLLEGWDVVCASRYMRGGKKVGGPKLQGVLSTLVNDTLSCVTGIPTRDISNSFKLYRREVLESIPRRADMGVEYSMVMILSLYFSGARITEVPTVWHGRTKGSSKFSMQSRFPAYLSVYLWAIGESIKQRIRIW